MKERNEAPMVYDYNTTHLLVLKADYDKNEVSLFVDPDLNQNEPKADVVVAGEEGALKVGLKVYWRLEIAVALKEISVISALPEIGLAL